MGIKYKKTLSRNDIGETGGHQAGIVVPKSQGLLQFFPQLNGEEFNPEAWITCIDSDGCEWKMRYIYYNGRTFSPVKSTRNEYRITHMTKLFSKYEAKAGDTVVFEASDEPGIYNISLEKESDICNVVSEEREPFTVVLRGWKQVF